MNNKCRTNSFNEMDVDLSHEDSSQNSLDKQALAEKKKEEGNEEYKSKNYDKAIYSYTEAINLCPSCAAYYGNRSAAYMMIYKYSAAIEDARKATTLDPNFIKGYLREAKCHLIIGDVIPSLRLYNIVTEKDPQNKTALAEKQDAKSLEKFLNIADTAAEQNDHRRVLYCMDKALQYSPSSSKFKLRKAECLALLQRYQESQEIANDMLQMSSSNVDAIYVRGMCLYYQDNIDKAYQHFQQVLRLAPDHEKAKIIFKKAKAINKMKEEGNTAFRSNKLDEAYDLYTEALKIDPNNIFTNSKLHCNRATVAAKLKKFDVAVEDCNRAIKLDSSYLKAYQRRAKCYMESEQYEEAVRDYEKILKMDKTRENQRNLQEAKLELKKSKRKDYYKILGVDKSATEDAIKKAYRKRALVHHPDRHATADSSVKSEQEKKFKEIGEAYSILSDPKKKSRYDNGQDLDGMPEGFDGHDIDPNMIFQQFFGGGGGGGAQHFAFSSNGGGFPGGFQFTFG